MVQFLSINFFFLDFFNCCWVFSKVPVFFGHSVLPGLLITKLGLALCLRIVVKGQNYLQGCTVHIDNIKSFICPTNAHKCFKKL